MDLAGLSVNLDLDRPIHNPSTSTSTSRSTTTSPRRHQHGNHPPPHPHRARRLASRAALEALSAARAIGGAVTVGLIGAVTGPAAAQLAGAGVARVLSAEAEALAQPRYATDAAAAEALARAAGATVIVAPAPRAWPAIAAGVAQRLGGRVDTHVTRSLRRDGLSATRWYYRQRIEATLSRTERPWVLLVDPGRLPACPARGRRRADGGAGPGRARPPSCSARRSPASRSPTSGEQTIRPDAELLFVAGAGWTKKQADGQAHADAPGS